MQAAFDRACVDDLYNAAVSAVQDVGADLFVRAHGVQRICARQVDERIGYAAVGEVSLAAVHAHACKVACAPMRAAQAVEQRAFTRVGVARKIQPLFH